MIGDITGATSIYIICGRTDMRKSINGLCAIIKDKLGTDINRQCIYLFCGRRCDRIKILVKEEDGITLLYKRLDVEGRYHWPRNASEVRPLTWRQFDWLMSGLDIDQPKAIKNPTNLSA